MKSKKSKKYCLDDQILGLVYKTEKGTIDQLTFVQTAESIFDTYPNATSPWSFLRRLQRERRRHLGLVFYGLKKVGHLSKDIKMIKSCFKEIGADNNERKEKSK